MEFVSPPFTKCFSTVAGTATPWHLQNSWYPREPECQRRWILPGTRCDWGSNRAYPRIVFVEDMKILVYVHGWPDLVACWLSCADFRVLFFRPTAILETAGRLQLLSEMILVFSVGSQSCLITGNIHWPTFRSTRIPVELCVSTLHKVFWCSHRHSNSLASLKLAICCIVPNTFLANHMHFHASTIDDYRWLTQVATPPPKRSITITSSLLQF